MADQCPKCRSYSTFKRLHNKSNQALTVCRDCKFKAKPKRKTRKKK